MVVKSSKPVDSSRYDDEWIKNAWGNEGMDALVQPGRIEPRPRVKRALDLCAIKPGMSLLDIACGRGEVPLIASQVGAYAVGIDYSDAILQVANTVRQKRRELAGEQASIGLVQSDACKLPFADHSFDRITMLDIIEHLTPPQLTSMFIEVKRLLKPDGYAVIHTLPNRWVYDIGYKWGRKVLRRLPVEPRSEIERQVHINEQDIIVLGDKLDECGLNYDIWLEQYMPAQARWKSESTQFNDNRDQLYPALAGWLGRLLELLGHTPLKLILSNDIYGVAWSGDAKPRKLKLPVALTESLIKLCFRRAK